MTDRTKGYERETLYGIGNGFAFKIINNDQVMVCNEYGLGLCMLDTTKFDGPIIEGVKLMVQAYQKGVDDAQRKFREAIGVKA